MASDDAIKVTGIITDVLPNSQFRVTIDNGHLVLAYLCGKMRKHFIRIIRGDKVDMELSPYDLTRGRITFRH